MALKSETSSPPNGVVDIIPMKSAQEPEEDLEDGEIFDDEEDEAPAAKPEPPAPPKESIATLVQQMEQMQQMAASGGVGPKRRDSPMDRARPRMTRSKRPAKRGRDDDRHFAPKKRRRSDDEKTKEMEEEDEIMGRDVSPNLRDWDRFRSDEDDDELGFNDGPGGGRGMGSRRGRRDFRSRRGGRGGRGGGRRGPNSRRDGGSLCKFFLQGNCQRGHDCPFSHQIHPKKYEMCKFYMSDCCVKKDKCNFMHEEFPCKFFHLGLKCYAGKKCKFSHDKVTPFIKQMLIKQNSAESDKHFLNHLITTADSRSPSPPDYSDYEAPHGNSNYVTVTRKRGSNRDDITVDDIELAVSDPDVDMEAEQSHSHSRSHRHRNQRSSRHSRDEDRSSRDYDHRENHKESRDNRDREPRDREREPRDRDREPRDRDHRGDRDYRVDRDHRGPPQRDRDWDRGDRDWDRGDRDWDREKEREQNPAYEERRSDEDEGRTPMPSPSQNSSDSYGMNRMLPRREMDVDSRVEKTHSPPPQTSKAQQRQLSKSPTPPNDNRHPSPPPPVTDEVPAESTGEVPPNLPKKQMELYLRIQQQQREAGNIEEEDGKDKEAEFKEDDWYSSDEEGGGGASEPLATILKKLKAQPSEPKPSIPAPSKVTLPNVSALPDIDISAVTRLLSSVRETIEQQKNTQPSKSTGAAESEMEVDKKPEPSKPEEKKRRDPRLDKDVSPPPSSFSSMTSAPPMKLPPLDIDLRVSRDASTTPSQMSRDVDLRQLPFKPVPMHQAAREIDASTTANPPIPWAPVKFAPPPKPDYSYVQPKNMMDPRLRRYQTGGGMMAPTPPLMNPMQMAAAGGFILPQFNHPPQQPSLPVAATAPPPVVRDPRQRALVNDPRRKPQGPPMAPPPGLQGQGPPYPPQGPFNPQGRLQGPPGMMYPRVDSDLRNPFNQSDIDLRFQQSAAHQQFP